MNLLSFNPEYQCTPRVRRVRAHNTTSGTIYVPYTRGTYTLGTNICTIAFPFLFFITAYIELLIRGCSSHYKHLSVS